MVKIVVVVLLNAGLLGFFIYLLRKKGILSYFGEGKWWLTWLSIAIITLMDELTSIFYVPAEAYAVVGVSAFVFIIGTSVLMRFLSNRMTEIAHILENHKIRGGGVYSFSYLVMGPKMSFIAVASILVDYILTAAISTVSAVYNGGSFFHLPSLLIFALIFMVIWGVAGLNILGVKENARFTFMIFIAASMVLLTLIVTGLIDPSPGQGDMIAIGFRDTWKGLTDGGMFMGLGFLIFGLASVLLAYSGIESVVQTAGLVRSWKDIRKAYRFLALTVGIVTPLVTAIVLTRTDLDFANHREDLITHFATVLNGEVFGVIVGALASFTLIMAVNTAFVASSELLERVAHRYGFNWLAATNKRDSLYRIHIINALLFSIVIAITAGSQAMLASMYAVGLVASFTINMGALVYYRYSQGDEQLEYKTSRVGTFIIFLVLLAVFVAIAIERVDGLLLWATVVIGFLVVGIKLGKKRSPEIQEYQRTDSPLALILQCAENENGPFNIFFRKPKDAHEIIDDSGHAYVTFFSPRAGAPQKLAPNHYLFPIKAESLYSRLVDFIELLEYDFPEHDIIFHLGWPTSSWVDRMSVGVMVFSLLRLPRHFPQYTFRMEYEHEANKGIKEIH